MSFWTDVAEWWRTEAGTVDTGLWAAAKIGTPIGTATYTYGDVVASTAISLALPGVGLWSGAARGARTVIGKLDDLKSLGPGERTMLDRLPNLGSPKANWAQNSGVLRQEMGRGLPIRDATVDSAGRLINNTGFLRAERNLLETRGWSYDQATRMWYPPAGP